VVGCAARASSGRAREFWLATVNAGSRPHLVPVFAAWSDSSFFVATKGTARKTRDMQDNGRCVVATKYW
jgi:hypothetical protein